MTNFLLLLLTFLVASFIMSYSFTDPYSNDVLSETMMIPFVDLLNHNHFNHAELKFGNKALKLIATRSINPVSSHYNNIMSFYT